MEDRERPIRIGILGHYGAGNLGDEATIAAVFESFRRLAPDIEVCGFSVNPDDTKRRHGVRAYPVRELRRRTVASAQSDSKPTAVMSESPPQSGLKSTLKKVPILFPLLRGVKNLIVGAPRLISRWRQERVFLRETRRLLRSEFDMILTTGSGQLLDLWGGAWAYPYTHYKWARMCQRAGIGYGIMSVGAGPIRGGLSRWFIRRAVEMAEYRSFRDESSRRLLESIGCSGDLLVRPDLAFSFTGGIDGDRNEPITNDTPAVVTPIPYCDPRYWPVQDEGRYRTYLSKLATYCRRLIERDTPVRLACNKPGVDTLVLDDLTTAVEADGFDTRGLLTRHDSESLEAMAEMLRSAGVVLATRFHGVLLACRFGCPTIGLAYGPKTRDMMDYLGVGEYCHDVDDFTPESLLREYDRAVAEQSQIRRVLHDNCRKQVSVLEAQYREVIELVRNRVGR